MDIKRNSVLIFSDGACSGNPGPGGWGSIIWTPDQQVKEIGGREELTTNNRMELTAALSALERTKSFSVPVQVYTDSTYVIKGMTEWLPKWKAKNWLTSQNQPVSNQDLWKKLSEQANFFPKVEWLYVAGHKGNPGNERADQIAVSFSKKTPIPLYEGSSEEYSIDPFLLETGRKPTRITSPPYDFPFYLTLTGTSLISYRYWKECETAVKGKSGIKYKKINSLHELEETLKKWNIDSQKTKIDLSPLHP